MNIQLTACNPNLLFYVRELSDEITVSDLAGFRIGKANVVDYLLSILPGQPLMSVRRKLLRGDDYFTIRKCLRIAAIGRICYASTPEVVLAKGEASLISLYTHPEYRGRGLYPRLLVEQLRYLASRGYSRAYIWVDRANDASIRGIVKAGFKPLAIEDAASD